MSLNIKTDDGYISVAGGSVEPLKYTAITGAGVTVNNDPESTGYRTIENTGVHSIETGTDKDNANGTILVQTGVASATNPAKPIAVKGLNNAAYKDVDTKVDSTTKTSEKLPTTKAVYDTLKKIEDGVFQRDTDAVSVKTVPSGVKNYAVVEKIYGGTKKFNQLAPDAWRNSSMTPTAQYQAKAVDVASYVGQNDGHKYYYAITLNGGVNLSAGYGYWSSSASKYVASGASSLTSPKRFSTIFTNDITPTRQLLYVIELGSSDFKAFTISNAIFVDLTKMFGAGNEPTLAEFEKLVDGTEDFTEGTLWSTPIESVVSQGINLFDGKVYDGAIRTLNGAEYIEGTWNHIDYIECKSGDILYVGNWAFSNSSNYGVAFYDENKTFVSSQFIPSTWMGNPLVEITVPSGNIKYVRMSIKKTYTGGGYIYRNINSSMYTPYFHNEIELPDAVKSLPDFGIGVDTYLNTVDFENGVYQHKCSTKKIGDFTYIQMPSDGLFFSTDISNSERSICSKYTFVNVNATDNTSANTLLNEGEYTYRHGTNDRLYFKDSTIANAGEFKTKNADVEIVYSLASLELKNISDIIRPIKCETGGTITLKNEHNLDVANTIIYEKEVL